MGINSTKKLVLISIFSLAIFLFINSISALTVSDCQAVALGGTITINGNNCVHTFLTSSSFNITSGSLSVTALVVAGGGGGGSWYGGGGGAGGLIYNTSYSITGNTSVTIGTGGAGGVGQAGGGNGTNSTFGLLIAVGGGAGASENAYAQIGGSGGGGSTAKQTPADNISNQGNRGGYASIGLAGGGGGGSSTIGENTSATHQGGMGGNGTLVNINGTAFYFAGGGGGGTFSTTFGYGGLGGGGNGSKDNGLPAIANTGGGGGGGGDASGGGGGNGGSGIVIISYQPPDTTPPDVNLTYPLNTTYNINVSAINYTSSGASNCWYSNSSGVWNSSVVTAGTNFTNVISKEGSNTWTVYCNDTSNNLNSSSVTFFKDTIFPQINLTYPLNTNYTSNITYLNYTFIEINPSVCWYSLDNGATNTTITCGNNVTSLNSNQGWNNWTVWINDTLGNLNSSVVTFYLDSSLPNAVILNPLNNTYSKLNQNFSVNLTDNLGLKNATLYIYSGSLVNQTSFTAEIVGTLQSAVGAVVNLLDGVYQWFFEVFDLSDNKFTTQNYTFTKDTINPNLTFTYPTNTTYTFSPNIINYSYGDINPSFCWYSNSSGVWNSSVVSARTNFTNVSMKEGANKFTIYCNDSANNLNSTTLSFSIDTIAPSLVIISPENLSYDSDSVLVNISSGGAYTWWNTNDTSNVTYSGSFTLPLINGNYLLRVYTNDSVNNVNTSSVSFNINKIVETPVSSSGGNNGNWVMLNSVVSNTSLYSIDVKYDKNWKYSEDNTITVYCRDINGTLMDVDSVNLTEANKQSFTYKVERNATGIYILRFLVKDNLIKNLKINIEVKQGDKTLSKTISYGGTSAGIISGITGNVISSYEDLRDFAKNNVFTIFLFSCIFIVLIVCVYAIKTLKK